MDDKALLQVYFYKTYLYQQSVKKALQYRATKSTEGSADNVVQNRYNKNFEWFYMYSPELFNLLQQLRTLKMSKSRMQRTKHTSNRAMKMAKNVTRNRRGFKKVATKKNIVLRPQYSVILYNQFFTYFFLHFFKMQAIILAKSLYKTVTTNALFKHEHQVLLYRTRFLKWHK